MELSELMIALDGVALEQLDDGRFVARSGVPGWCRRVRPHVRWEAPVTIEDEFPFLTVFLPEAECVWARCDPLLRTASDLWAEADDAGEIHLKAIAARLGSARALLILRSEHEFAERQTLLQRARDLRMTHTALMREIEQKDVLVHAIVHDLAAPLHSIIGVLSLVMERAHSDQEAGWLRLAMQAANRQRELISEILDVFVAEGGALHRPETDGVTLSAVTERVLAESEPIARGRGLRVTIEPEGPQPYRVAGEETRLFRVLMNLVDNALRHSPRGGVVRLSTRQDDGTVTVFVDDEGPGVAAEFLPRVFDKFARAERGRSGSGLGLFFCRITVESWGGAIGYEQRASGGARFWIRLRLAP